MKNFKNYLLKSYLFLGVGKTMKVSDLKSLHPDIVDVRCVASHAWLVFSNETACDKAYKTLSKKKIEGKLLVVDFCGPKSINKTNEKKGNFFLWI